MRNDTLDAGAPAVVEKKPEIENTPHAKITFEAPASMTPDKTCEVKIRLKGVNDGLKLKCDLHYQKASGGFGGMNAWGGEGHTVKGDGPYSFRFKPADKPGLGYFVLTAFLSPTGEWKDQVEIARWSVPVEAGAATIAYHNPSIKQSNFLDRGLSSAPSRGTRAA